MRLAILGGSFNPPHEGHLLLARAALAAGYDKVLLVPAAQPPHKGSLEGAGQADRWAMTLLLSGLQDGLEAWDGELRRGGRSYSIDTVREVTAAFEPEGKPGLILGDDLAAGFGSWREADRLAEEADLLLARRSSGGPPDFPWPCRRLDNPLFPQSSTDVRNRIADGLPLDGEVPAPIAEYIRRKGLYAG